MNKKNYVSPLFEELAIITEDVLTVSDLVDEKDNPKGGFGSDDGNDADDNTF